MERQIAEYERRLRAEMLREHELAELAARQHEEARNLPTRMLPMLGQKGAGGGGTELHA